MFIPNTELRRRSPLKTNESFIAFSIEIKRQRLVRIHYFHIRACDNDLKMTKPSGTYVRHKCKRELARLWL